MKSQAFSLVESLIALVLFSGVTLGFYALTLDIRTQAISSYYQTVAKSQLSYLKQAHLAGVPYSIEKNTLPKQTLTIQNQQQKLCWQWQGQHCEVL